MTEQKNIILSILISTLVASGATAGTILLFNNFDSSKPQYYCPTRLDLGYKSCDSFSKYVSDFGKCNFKDGSPSLICKEGWVLVTNDAPKEETPVQETHVFTGKREAYACNNGCEAI